MARGYVSVKGKACNGKKAYLVKGNLTYKGKKAYVVKNGKTCLSWSGTESGEMVVTSSGTITIPSGVSLVDIFCVGGGGGAGGWTYIENYKTDGSLGLLVENYGGGGGGGYTSTALDVPVTPGETLTVTIGAGGRTGRSYNMFFAPSVGINDEYGTNNANTDGADGGTTSVKRGSTTLCTASGGEGGGCVTSSSTKGRRKGGDGGSGGCGGGYYNTSDNKNVLAYNGGTDGGDGDTGYDGTDSGLPGSGQGFTTRAFEESNGTLYASGGDGAGNTASATANSGDGANVAIGADINSSGYVDRYGGSGVVIIRWKEREV